MENIIIIIWLVIITGISISNLVFKVGYRHSHELPMYKNPPPPPERKEVINIQGFMDIVNPIGIAMENINCGDLLETTIDGKISKYNPKKNDKRPEFEPEWEFEGKTNYPISFTQFELITEYLENEQLIDSNIDYKSEYDRFIKKNYKNELDTIN